MSTQLGTTVTDSIKVGNGTASSGFGTGSGTGSSWRSFNTVPSKKAIALDSIV